MQGRQRDRQRWRRVVAGRERPLQPLDVVPRPVLEPDSAEHADGSEAESAMKSVARRVRQRDASVSVLVSLKREHAKEGLVEGAANAAAVRAFVDVRRHLDRPLICRARPVCSRVRVSDDPSVVFGHEPGNPPAHLPCVRRRQFERRSAVGDRGSIDLADRGGVGGLRQADHARNLG